MAHDKRGQILEPQIEDGLDELTNTEPGEDFAAGPTSRNTVGDAKRAARQGERPDGRISQARSRTRYPACE